MTMKFEIHLPADLECGSRIQQLKMDPKYDQLGRRFA